MLNQFLTFSESKMAVLIREWPYVYSRWVNCLTCTVYITQLCISINTILMLNFTVLKGLVADCEVNPCAIYLK